MRRLVPIVIALTLVASSTIASRASAQILPVPRRSSVPTAWVSLSAGLLQLQTVRDGSTQADWHFGNALQYRGSLEVELSNSGSLGFAFGLADVPLSYVSAGSTEPLPGTCAGVCDAHASLWTMMGTFRTAGGAGFHQVIEFGLGATVYRDFEADDGGELPPPRPDTDLAFSFSYGFGYGLTPRMQIVLAQDAAYVIHQRDGLSGGADTTSEQFVTRIGLRVGFGGR